MKVLIFKVLRFLVLLILHISAVFAILYAFLPLARWYLNYRPFWGVDFFLLGNLSKILSLNFVAPFAFWNYAGFGGWPAFFYPSLHTYIIYFFSRFFDLVYGLGLWMMASTALFILGVYFLVFLLSRSVVMAAFMAIGAAYSSGVYQTLTWAGSLPSFATQAAFPWSLFFLVWYFQSGRLRHLLAASLVSGISIWGHPLVFIVYILPATLLLIFLRFNGGLAILSKIRAALIFIIVVILLGLPLFATTFKNAVANAFKSNYTKSALSTTTNAPSELEIGIAEFNRAQVKRAYSDNHVLPFALLGVSALVFLPTLVAVRQKRIILETLPYAVVAAYFAFYIWLFGQGISIYHGGWYRLFWSVPVWVGALGGVLWGEAFGGLSSFIKNRLLRLFLFLGSNAAVFLIGAALVWAYGLGVVISMIDYRSQVSSAYPDVINLVSDDEARFELRERLVPEWLDGDDTNWRLYDADQTVNLWWNNIFKMPLARGYLDPPILNEQRGFIFLLDAALSETEREPQLAKVFGYPHQTAISNALFLIDWNAIRFYEGGHTSDSYTPLPKYLDDIITSREELVKFKERYSQRPQELRFYEFKRDLTSPILAGTNASTLGIFASENGYEIVVRAIAESDNINSQKLIPLKLGRNIDDYNLAVLKRFDGLYLYDYDFKKGERAFKTLTEYVREGGKIYVDTGVEVRNSSGALPEFFPISEVERKGMGRQWDIEASQTAYSRGVDFSQFSPLVFDDSEWNVSGAREADVRDGAMVILKHKGKVVVASHKLGNGEVIWGGFNLAYHILRDHNQQEAKFFNNILGSIVDISKKPAPVSQATFISPNERVVETEGAKGILFKEMAYKGWNARLLEGAKDKKLTIYPAGPANPGFMYVPVSKERVKVKFSYSGSAFDKLIVSIPIILGVLIFEEVAFGGVILGRARRAAFRFLSGKVGRWWQKEDE